MKYAILLTAGVLVGGCAQREPPERTTQVEANRPSVAPVAPGAAPPATSAPSAEPGVPPDNTDKNDRDRSGAALTPGDQGGSAADRELTQQIRKRVIANDALSSDGKNVKIVTIDGVVTLRGPVKNAEEQASIVSIARSVHGVKRVDNQLETAAK